MEGAGAEIIPGKDSDTRIKPLALTNGHGRYITVTPERTLTYVRWGISVKYIAVEFLAVSLPKPPFGGFRSETVIWTEVVLKIRWNF